MTEEEVRKLAEDHWEWHERFLREVFEVPEETLKKYKRVAIDYFIHGAKHGKEK